MRHRLIRACTLPAAMIALAAGKAPAKTPERTPAAPFAQARRAGPLLLLSGQIGTAPPAGSGAVAGPTTPAIDFAARQAMDRIGELLRANGASYHDVVACTVMLADIADWDRFNAVYVTSFEPNRLPVRSAFGVTGLAHGALVEVQCTAYPGGS